MPGETCVAIIEPDEIYREGLRHVIDGAGMSVFAVCSDTGMLDHALSECPDLNSPLGVSRKLLVIADGSRDPAALAATVRDLRHKVAEARVVVIAPSGADAVLRQALDCDFEGILLRPIGPDALLQSIRRVCRGERIRPTGPCGARAMSSAPTAACVAAVLARLSQREREVLGALGEGNPNKVIARRYGITEATVKVHVKAILRKLGVSNRTEAALLARDYGRPSSAAPVPALAASGTPGNAPVPGP